MLVCIYFLIIPTTLAQEPADIYRYEELTINLIITGEIIIEKENSAAVAKEIDLTLKTVPREDTRQDVTSITTSPEATETEEGYAYAWNNPSEEELPFKLDATVQTTAKKTKITKEIPFPLEEVPENIQTYLEETEMVDFSDKEIKKTATELAEGETNALVVAVKIADWVQNNIEYNLTTLTAGAAQSASWTLENKYGVCDEMTNLYIALLRAVGIPARFSVGISYTNSELFSNPWTPHGWAEVYFPEYGWVPFDVTYGQFEFIDATHIKFGDSLDAKQESVEYQWTGRSISAAVSEIMYEAEIEAYGEKENLPITIEGEIYKEETGFGSYNYIKATITNNANYYLPLQLHLVSSKEITIENEKQTIVLNPQGEKTIFWPMHITEDLNPQYEYTFEAIIYTITNQTEAVAFQANPKRQVYTKKQIEESINALKEEEGKVYSKDVDVECMIGKKEFYQSEDVIIMCKLANKGNTAQKLNICAEEECNKISIGIADQQEVEFTNLKKTIGTHTVFIKAENDDIQKTEEVEYKVVDEPNIKITVTAPKEATKAADVPIEIVVEKMSEQTPKNVTVRIEYANKEKWWNIEEIYEAETITETINTDDFRRVNNIIRVNIIYHDFNGEEYKTEEEISVTLTNVTFFDRLKRYILLTLGI